MAFSIDQSIPYLMSRVVGRLNRRLHDQLAKMGLTFQHWRVLATLSTRKEPTIADISAYAVIPHSTLSRLLTRMETDRLVRRASSSEDRRIARIAMTAKGERVYKKILPLAIGIRKRALTEFTQVEEQQLRVFLLRMLSNLPQTEGNLRIEAE